MRALLGALCLALLALPALAAPAGAITAKRIGAPFYDLNFLSNALPATATIVRASTATDLLSSASTCSFNSYAAGVVRQNPQNGLLVEEARTNSLLNSGAPATQTTTSLATGYYTLWMIGTGSVTVSAGTATITGAATASQGTPVIFNVTVAGTVTATVSGSPSCFQLENGPGPTSYIPTTASPASRAADQITITSSAFTPYGGTFAITLVLLSGGNISTDNHIIFSNGPTPFAVFHNNNLSPVSVVTDAGGSILHPDTMTFGATHMEASTWGLRGISITFDGNPVAYASLYNSSGYATWPNYVTIFNENSTELGSGWVRRMRFWNYQVDPQMLLELSNGR